MALDPLIYRKLLKKGYLQEGPYQYQDVDPLIRRKLEKKGYLPEGYSLTEAHMPRTAKGEIAFPEPTVGEAAVQEVFGLGQLITEPRETAGRLIGGLSAAQKGINELSRRIVTPMVPGLPQLQGKTPLEAAQEQIEAVQTIGTALKEPLKKYRHPVREFKRRPITTSLEFAWDASVVVALTGLGLKAAGGAARIGKTVPIITEAGLSAAAQAGETVAATTRAARAGTTAIKVGERMIELSNMIDPTFPLVRGFERATQRGSVIIGTLLEKKALRNAAKAASKEGLSKAAVFDDAVAGLAKIAEAEKPGWGEIIVDDLVDMIETGGRGKAVTHADVVGEAIKAKEPLTMTYLTKGKDPKVRTITELRWAKGKGKNIVSAMDSISGERRTFAIRNIQGFEGIQSAPSDVVREIYGKWRAMPEDEQRLWYAINNTAKQSIEEGNPKAAATLWDEIGKEMNVSREEAMDIFLGAKEKSGEASAKRLRGHFDLKGKSPEEAAETVADALKDTGVADDVAEAMGEDIATATVQATAKGVTPEQQSMMRTLGYTEVQINNITSKGAERVTSFNIPADRADVNSAGVLSVQKAPVAEAPPTEVAPEMPVADPKRGQAQILSPEMAEQMLREAGVEPSEVLPEQPPAEVEPAAPPTKETPTELIAEKIPPEVADPTATRREAPPALAPVERTIEGVSPEQQAEMRKLGFDDDQIEAYFKQTREDREAAKTPRQRTVAPEVIDEGRPEDVPLIREMEVETPEAVLTLKPTDNLQAPEIESVRVDTIETDPERFQYKIGTGQEGISGTLKSAKKFDELLSGIIHVWVDPADGKTYVINGHNRLALAKASGVENVTVRYLDAETPADARTKGAMINIAEGRGTPIDAAKLFRDNNINKSDLEEFGIAFTEKVASDGVALASLHPSIFGATSRGEFPLQRAVVIGSELSDHTQQLKLIELIDRESKKGKKITDDIVRELAQMTKAAPTTRETEMTLFGEEALEESYVLEKAQLLAYIKQQLGREKRLFAVVGKSANAKELAKAGNVIDIKSSQNISDEAAQLLAIFDALKHTQGDISATLNDASTRIGKGGNANAIKAETYERIREQLTRTLTRGEIKPQTPKEIQQRGAIARSTGRSLPRQLERPLPLKQESELAELAPTDDTGQLPVETLPTEPLVEVTPETLPTVVEKWKLTRDENRIREMEKAAQSSIPAIAAANAHTLEMYMEGTHRDIIEKSPTVQRYDNAHRAAVQQAISEGKPVTREVKESAEVAPEEAPAPTTAEPTPTQALPDVPETVATELSRLKEKHATLLADGTAAGEVSPEWVRGQAEAAIKKHMEAHGETEVSPVRSTEATDEQVQTITEKYIGNLSVHDADAQAAQEGKEETAGVISNFIKSEEGFARRPTKQDLKRAADTLKAIAGADRRTPGRSAVGLQSDRIQEFTEATKYLLGHHVVTPETILNSQGPEGRIFTRELRLIDGRYKAEAGRVIYDVVFPIRKELTDLEWENMVDVLEDKANPINEKVETAAGKLRTEYDKVADEWIRLEGTIRIYDEFGKPHDIPFKKRENYFQHSYPAEMFKDKEFMDEIVSGLAEEMDVPEIEARKIIEQAMMDKTGMRMGNLEMARTTDMPGYRRDAGSVIKYFTNAWKRVELSRSFGPKYEKFDTMTDSLKESGADPILMREVFGVYTGNIPMSEGLRKHVVPVTRQLKRFQILTKMGRATIANFFEGQNIPMAFSWKSNLKGIFDWRTKEGRRQLDITGAVLHDALRHIGTGAEKDWVFQIGAPGFSIVERNLRRVAAASGGRWFKDNEAMLHKAIAKGNKRREATARRELKRWGFDPDDVLENSLGLPENDKRMREGMNMAADFTQKAYGALDIPPGFMGPYGSAITQFKSWTLMQAKFMVDNAYRAGVEAFTKGNFMPLARYLVALGVFAVTGEAVNELRSWLYHKDRTGLYGGIAKGELSKKEIATLIAKDFLTVTSLGQMSIILDALEYHDPFGAVLGPLAGDISAVERIIRKPSTAAKEALKRVPVVGAPAASIAFPRRKKKKGGLRPLRKKRRKLKSLAK